MFSPDRRGSSPKQSPLTKWAERCNEAETSRLRTLLRRMIPDKPATIQEVTAQDIDYHLGELKKAGLNFQFPAFGPVSETEIRLILAENREALLVGQVRGKNQSDSIDFASPPKFAETGTCSILRQRRSINPVITSIRGDASTVGVAVKLIECGCSDKDRTRDASRNRRLYLVLFLPLEKVNELLRRTSVQPRLADAQMPAATR